VNKPPAVPTIDGTRIGTIGYKYEYTFITTDPENDDVFYYVEWGDDTSSGWVGPNQSSQPCILSHTWDDKGTYIIRAKAKDMYNTESEWGTFIIKMPTSHTQMTDLFLHVFEQLFERFPQAFPILQFLYSFSIRVR
jgi:hypothetical protein